MKLLLSGGGQNVASLDTLFAAHIDARRTVLYLPVAQEATDYAQCLEGFKRIYAPYGITRIEMCADLRQVILNDRYTAIYLDGGNTFKLLKEVKESGFDEKMVAFLRQGGFVYGRSAGSIIFGRDILPTTYEDENEVQLQDSTGLNLAGGFDICCHYGDEASRRYKRDRILALSGRSQGTIALPDDCGIFVEDETISFIGSGAVLFPAR